MLAENSQKPLMPVHRFYRKLFRNFILAFIIITFCLLLGVSGYMAFGHMHFVDALLNASMILSGMGPVDVLDNDPAKYFASFYAIFSGIVFLTTAGFVIAPMLHRVLHKFHLEGNKK